MGILYLFENIQGFLFYEYKIFNVLQTFNIYFLLRNDFNEVIIINQYESLF